MGVVAIIALAFAISLFLPPDPKQFHAYSLIPAVFLLFYIFCTRRVIEGLILAVLIGIIMVSKPDIAGDDNWILNSFSMFNRFLMETLQEENTQWLIIVCG